MYVRDSTFVCRDRDRSEGGKEYRSTSGGLLRRTSPTPDDGGGDMVGCSTATYTFPSIHLSNPVTQNP
ncbi:hypothetical protein L1987_16124 [Smallanthus sonchifolius]|uniref:Uncharacterized protein n=1 Tax=Smallanthus sonchifolius TaxID=185202 RepID=A0ACB9J7H9_9ASTR|nr:hypothetical protein L1987_16124 [Smallanthus sonchifolius]